MPNGYNPDELLVNDGADYTNGVYYPETPEEVKEAGRTADAVVSTSYPVMQNVIEWFDEAIAECDSIDNIEMATMTYANVKYERKVSIEAQVFAYQLLKQLLQDKKSSFGEFAENGK